MVRTLTVDSCFQLCCLFPFYLPTFHLDPGKLISNLARLRISDVVDEANEKHLQPWAELCREHGISTQLSPFMHKELLGHNHVYMDGSKLQSTGFEYKYPQLELEEMASIIRCCIDQVCR